MEPVDYHIALKEELFKSTPTLYAVFLTNLGRVLAACAFTFSIYNFSENPFFFIFFMIGSLLLFLLIGTRQLTVYKSHILITTNSFLKTSLLEWRYFLNDVKEVYYHVPFNKTLSLNKTYRFHIIFEAKPPKTFWISAEDYDLAKAVELINRMILDKSFDQVSLRNY